MDLKVTLISLFESINLKPTNVFPEPYKTLNYRIIKTQHLAFKFKITHCLWHTQCSEVCISESISLCQGNRRPRG